MSYPPIPSILRVGKVVQVNRYDHSVDIVFDDGALARNVPVMTGWGGSTFGFAGLAAPSFWSSQPRWPEKTYPRPGGTEATDDTTRTTPQDADGKPLPAKLIQPTTNLDEELPDGTILEKEGRDIYAVVAPIEGSVSGAVGLVVLGFVYPMVAEMLFPPTVQATTTAQVEAGSTRVPIGANPTTLGFTVSGKAFLAGSDLFQYTGVDAAGFTGVTGIGATHPIDTLVEQNRFVDLALVRHPSDLQVTVDSYGTLSIQHPSGGQITLDYVAEDAPTEPVDLQGQDYDGRYTLRNNTPASIPLEGRKPQLLFRIPRWIVEGMVAKLVGEVLVRLKNTGDMDIKAIWGDEDDKGVITVVAGEAITLTAGDRIVETAEAIYLN